MKKSLGRRLISGITSALLAVSYAVPSSPVFGAGAVSEVDPVTLLVGENSPLRGSDVTETLKKAENAYAIGIASQFSVFLNGDFYDNGCDSEGRTAVGGSINLGTATQYDVGSGDYLDKYSLESLLNDSGYAHVIAGGSIQNLSRSSNDSYKDLSGNDLGKTGKIFVYGDSINEGSLMGDSKYVAYKENLIDFAATFKMLNDRSTLLASQQSQGAAFSADPTEVETITYFWQYNPASKDGEVDNNRKLSGVAHFNYDGPETEVVKFNLTEEEWQQAEKCQYFSFEGIPDNAYIIVSAAGKTLDLVQYKNDMSHTFDRFTAINGQSISKGYFTYDEEGNLHGKWNNDAGVSRLLYNFYEAKDVTLKSSFQGTILAPNASFLGKDSGHLSGALIADNLKEGSNFEFGYRPYLGPFSILELSSKYTINLSKFSEDGKTPLKGATLGFFEVKDGAVSESPSDTVETDGNALMTVNVNPGKYVVKEIAAPDGYTVSDTEYYIEIKENGKFEDKEINVGSHEVINNKVYKASELTEDDLASGEYVPIKTRPTYNVKCFAYSDNNEYKDTCKISKFILTYLDGTTAELEVPADPPSGEDYWYVIQIDENSYNKDGIVKIEAVIAPGSGNRKVIVQDTDNTNLCDKDFTAAEEEQTITLCETAQVTETDYYKNGLL